MIDIKYPFLELLCEIFKGSLYDLIFLKGSFKFLSYVFVKNEIIKSWFCVTSSGKLMYNYHYGLFRQSTILQNEGASSSKSPSSFMDFPWLDKYYVQLTSSTPSDVQELASDKFMINMSNLTFLGRWTHPYFLCASRKWLVSYSVPIKSAATTNYK